MEEVKSHKKEIETLNVDIRSFASRTDVRALAKELENQGAAIRLCADTTALNEVSKSVSQVISHLISLSACQLIDF